MSADLRDDGSGLGGRADDPNGPTTRIVMERHNTNSTEEETTEHETQGFGDASHHVNELLSLKGMSQEQI